MTKLEIIFEMFPDEEFLKADGLDDALIGVETKTMRLIYSSSACIEILAKTMGFENAVEYFGFNIECAYMGEKTPIFCEEIVVDNPSNS